MGRIKTEMHLAKLRGLVDEMYRVFDATVTRTGDISTCGCCVDEAGGKELNDTPIREWTDQHTLTFEASAHRDQVDTRYVFPRVCELLVQGEDPLCFPLESLINWDDESCWRTWPEEEQCLVKEFAIAYFEAICDWGQNELREEVGEVVSLLIGLDMDPVAMLRNWFGSDDPRRVAGALRLLEDTEAPSIEFWVKGKYAGQEAELTDMFFSARGEETIEKAMDAAEEGELKAFLEKKLMFVLSCSPSMGWPST